MSGKEKIVEILLSNSAINVNPVAVLNYFLFNTENVFFFFPP